MEEKDVIITPELGRFLVQDDFTRFIDDKEEEILL